MTPGCLGQVHCTSFSVPTMDFDNFNKSRDLLKPLSSMDKVGSL